MSTQNDIILVALGTVALCLGASLLFVWTLAYRLIGQHCQVMEAMNTHVADSLRLLGSRDYAQFSEAHRVEAPPAPAPPLDLNDDEKRAVAERYLWEQAQKDPNSIGGPG